MNYNHHDLINNVADILKDIPDKWEDKDTTTKIWKTDLILFTVSNEVESILEIGAAKGYTTYALAPFVRKITSVELSTNRQQASKTLNALNENIEYFSDDVYAVDWSRYGHHDMVIIDCIHTYDAVIQDINNAITHIKPTYLAFDDYGLFVEVKKAVDTFIDAKTLTVISNLGMPTGTSFHMTKNPYTTKDRILNGPEGIVCRVNYF